VPALARQLDPVAAGVQRSIKQALDPEGLFNPGKAIPAVEAAAAVERRIRNG
jgi:FAD/FMN-containing dehydrogenase